MDNITHSLAGAVLGQLGLKKKTGLGMATLIIAANIPDIDAFAALLGGHQHLAIRRGITHGPIAMLLLPIMLTGIMLWFDRWQTDRGKRPVKRLPIHKGWLLTLAFIGTLSHPALDWLNSYGIRLLEPFSSKWFYGDSIFIIDIWIWAALIAGLWISRRREKRNEANWQRPAWISFAAISAYIFANGLITGKAESETVAAVTQRSGLVPTSVVANPVPVTFWRREMLWEFGEKQQRTYGEAMFDLFGEESFVWNGDLIVNNASADIVDRARESDIDSRAFLFWARMPVIQQEPVGPDDVLLSISDMRFRSPLLQGRFAIQLKMARADIDDSTARGRGDR